MKKSTATPGKPVQKKVAPSVEKKPSPVKKVTPKDIAPENTPPPPPEVITSEVAPEIIEAEVTENAVDVSPSVADLKASLNDIPASKRTPESWKARIEVHISTHGYEAADELTASNYFDKWVKGK